MKNRITESVRLSAAMMAYARAYKTATGVSMSVLIEEAFNKQIDKIPKKVKAKMVQIDPTLVF